MAETETDTTQVQDVAVGWSGGRVTIKTTDPGPSLAISAWIGEAGPTVTGGFGGWQLVARPRRISFTQWQGRDPIQMDLPIVIDGYDGSGSGVRVENSIEPIVTRLERMALPWHKTPPTVKVTGSASNLVPHDDLTWIINTLAWGAVLRGIDGNRQRQEVTIGLVSYQPVTKLKLRAAQQSRNASGRA